MTCNLEKLQASAFQQTKHRQRRTEKESKDDEKDEPVKNTKRNRILQVSDCGKKETSSNLTITPYTYLSIYLVHVTPPSKQ